MRGIKGRGVSPLLAPSRIGGGPPWKTFLPWASKSRFAAAERKLYPVSINRPGHAFEQRAARRHHTSSYFSQSSATWAGGGEKSQTGKTGCVCASPPLAGPAGETGIRSHFQRPFPWRPHAPIEPFGDTVSSYRGGEMACFGSNYGMPAATTMFP